MSTAVIATVFAVGFVVAAVVLYYAYCLILAARTTPADIHE